MSSAGDAGPSTLVGTAVDANSQGNEIPEAAEAIAAGWQHDKKHQKTRAKKSSRRTTITANNTTNTTTTSPHVKNLKA